MTNRALRFVAMLDRLENAVSLKTIAEIAKHPDEIAIMKSEYQKHRARIREYVKTLKPEDLESL